MEAAVPPVHPGGEHLVGEEADPLTLSGPKKYVLLVSFPFVMVMLLVSIYAGTMHSPKPKDMPVAVVGASAPAGQMAAGLNSAASSPVDARVVATPGEALQLLHDRKIVGAFVLPTGANRNAVLYSAQADGASQAGMVEAVFEPVAAAQHMRLTEHDMAPLPARDGLGITLLLTAIGFMLAGYLPVSLLTTAAPELHPLRRLVPVMAGWSALMGVVIWLLVGPLLGAVHGHAAAVIGVGWLAMFATAMAQLLIARFLGPLAVLPGVAVFVFLGVPASNISIPVYAVPGFFSFLHDVLPLPAAAEALRSFLYYGGDGAGVHLAVLAAWAAAGILLTALVDLRRHRRKPDPDRELSGLTAEPGTASDSATGALATG